MKFLNINYKKRTLLSIILTFTFFTQTHCLFDFTKLTGDNTDFAFPTEATSKKKQLEDLQQALKQFTTKSEEEIKIIDTKLTNIQTQITESQKQQIESSDDQKELLTQKINILNDRKQILNKTTDLYKETIDIINAHVKTLSELINLQEEKPTEDAPKTLYSWKEFKEAQKKIENEKEKQQLEQNRSLSLSKQKNAEKETLESLKKQKIEIENDRNNLSTEQKKPDFSDENISIKAEILDQKLNLINEKINYSNLKIKNIEEEKELKNSIIKKINYYLDKLSNYLTIIENRLELRTEDIQLAKSDWEEVRKKEIQEKIKLDKKRDRIKKEKDDLNKKLELIIEEIKLLKEEKNQKKLFLSQSQKTKIKEKIYLLDKELKLLDIKKDRQDSLAKTQKLEYEIINAYFSIGNDPESIEQFLKTFKTEQSQVSTSINLLKDKQKESNRLLAQASRDFDSLKSKIEKIKNQKGTVFETDISTYNEIMSYYDESKTLLNQKIRVIQDYQAAISDLISREEKIHNKYTYIIKDLETKHISISIWKRSPKAITFAELSSATQDLEKFATKLFWDTPSYLGPNSIISNIKSLRFNNYLSLLFFILLFIILLIGSKKILRIIKKRIISKNEIDSVKFGSKYLKVVLDSLVELALNNYTLSFTWLFIYLHVVADFKYIFSFIKFLANPYSISIFYLISIPILIYLFKQFISTIKIINQKLGSIFFTDKSQIKFLFLIKTILYSTAILIPFRKAFLIYITEPSTLPNVIIAAYSLILVIVILFFFWKEDVIALIPSQNKFFISLKNLINKYYYPVFIFLMGLLILSNPYIGYSNLAWYLAFAIPSSIFLIYGIFVVHYYIRKYSISFFLEEEDDEIKDKFDHAKTYYGFFSIATFLTLLFFGFILLARIWGFIYTPTYLWKILSEDFVIRITSDVKLGLIQLLTLITFLAIGFIISTLIHNFILNKLFDIFRTEPGTQNTASRILHYTIIAFAIILGFSAIGLPQFILTISAVVGVGVGFALKDLAADIIAGFIVLLERPIEIGNYIEIDENNKGTVHKISARATTIRTARNFSLIIPNKDIISNPITNWGIGRLAVGFELNIMVEYSANPELVKKVLKETIEQHPLVLTIPSVTIRLEDFLDSGIKFFVRAFMSSRRVREQWEVASDIRFAILKAFKENNIVIPFPQQVIHFAKDTNFVKPIDIKFDKSEK